MTLEQIRIKIGKKVVRQYKDDKEVSMSKLNRLRDVSDSIMDWKVSTVKENMMDIENTIWQTRGCFQTTCSEWDRTNMDEKVKLLKDLADNHDLDVFQLSMRMKVMGVEDFNKDITDLDLVMAMSEIIDYLLKDKK